jgi:hypothetical protein
MTLDQQIRDIAKAAATQLSGQIEERLLGLATELSQAAASDRVSVVRELRLAAEAEVAKRSQEAVVAAQAEHSRRLEEAVSAARQEGDRRLADAVAAARAEVQRERDTAMGQLRADLSREHEVAMANLRTNLGPQIEAALSTARAEHASTLAETQSRARADAEQRVAQALDEAKRETAAELERVRREAAEDVEAARRQTRDAVDAVRRELSGETEEARRLRDDTERALVDARVSERQHQLAQVERLTDGIRRIDGAKSLTEVLDALAETAAREAPRVAVFVLRGTRFTGWRHSGFPPGVDPSRMELPVDQPGLLSRALLAAAPVSTSEGPAGDPTLTTPFGVLADDNAGLAVPVRIGGETVAILYADDAVPGHAVPGHAVPSPFPEAIEALACHAARCLEVLTFTRAAAQSGPARPARPGTALAPPAPGLHSTSVVSMGAGSQPPLVVSVPDVPPTPRYAAQTRSFQPSGDEDEDAARRYARLLVSEIKLYHEAAVADGRRGRNLLERLRPEIERAQHLYEERVPVQVRLKSDFFGQELVRTLAGGDPTLLGAR